MVELFSVWFAARESFGECVVVWAVCLVRNARSALTRRGMGVVGEVWWEKGGGGGVYSSFSYFMLAPGEMVS